MIQVIIVIGISLSYIHFATANCDRHMWFRSSVFLNRGMKNITLFCDFSWLSGLVPKTVCALARTSHSTFLSRDPMTHPAPSIPTKLTALWSSTLFHPPQNIWEVWELVAGYFLLSHENVKSSCLVCNLGCYQELPEIFPLCCFPLFEEYKQKFSHEGEPLCCEISVPFQQFLLKLTHSHLFF